MLKDLRETMLNWINATIKSDEPKESKILGGKSKILEWFLEVRVVPGGAGYWILLLHAKKLPWGGCNKGKTH